eukprot:TRINITY_DN83553_c0_g1_i1.p3 TRINITY_DN83553_c0_g1~~TRINITY_DN83553_c0_g1_i1.p3  ORF type:complete len:102 (+),score=13.51 TRINITY_DN83553_c0_g1_i1:75-380(+)
MAVPKKKFTQFLTRRKRLLFYMDHYRWLFKVRRAHWDRKMYQDAVHAEDYQSPAFRYPGFWPDSFGYYASSDARTAGFMPAQAAPPAVEASKPAAKQLGPE